MGRGARTSERARVGSFWWLRWGGVPEHQNEPVWARSDARDERKEERRCASTRTSHTRARSGVRDEGEGEGRCASTRMCPCGHVLVFKMGRGEERCVSTRKCPHGHFLVFKMREGKREHQNVPTR